MEASIKKIVLATDFSDISKNASRYALMLAKTHKAELKALHVYEPRPSGVSEENYLPPEYYISNEDPDKTRQRGKNILEELVKSFDQKVKTIFKVGHPGPEIIRVAEEENADLLVLGTHGHKGWERFTMGSVAEFVVRNAPCAVLIIRPRGN